MFEASELGHLQPAKEPAWLGGGWEEPARQFPPVACRGEKSPLLLLVAGSSASQRGLQSSHPTYDRFPFSRVLRSRCGPDDLARVPWRISQLKRMPLSCLWCRWIPQKRAFPRQSAGVSPAKARTPAAGGPNPLRYEFALDMLCLELFSQESRSPYLCRPLDLSGALQEQMSQRSNALSCCPTSPSINTRGAGAGCLLMPLKRCGHPRLTKSLLA